MKGELKFRKPGHVYSVNVDYWDFVQQHGKMGINPSNHQENDPDIYLTKEGIDIKHLRDTSIVTVGGYVHWSDASDLDQGLYISDAALTKRHLNSRAVGIINFEEINGKVNYHRIKDEHIWSYDRDDRLDRMIKFQVPGLEEAYVNGKRNKLIGLSFCGELYWLGLDGDILKQLNADTFVFSMQKWHPIEKIYHLGKVFPKIRSFMVENYIDGRVMVAEVLSSEFIRRLFTLSQTFLITVDLPIDKEVVVEYQYVPSHQLPDRYFASASTFSHAPLRLSDGRYPGYFYYDDRNGIVMAVEHSKVYPQINDTLNRHEQQFTVERAVSSRPGKLREAKFLNIYLDT